MNKTQKPASAISLTGNNTYAIKQRLDELVNGFLAEHESLGLERIDAEEAEPKQIIEAVKSLAFLAPNKMVVIRALSQNKPAAEQIEQILDSIPDTTQLIIYEPLTDKRTSYYKVLKSKTQLEEYTNPDGLTLAKWLVGEASKHQAKLTFADAQYLVERVGANQAMLASELEKLITYNVNVSRENINLLTDAVPQSKVFELLEAAFGGNKSRALKLYDEQRSQKVEPQEIIAMIAWQLRLIALAKYADGRSANQIAKDSGLNAYPVTKAMNISSKIASSKLQAMIDDALLLDYKSKTTSIDLNEALKNYIVGL